MMRFPRYKVGGRLFRFLAESRRHLRIANHMLRFPMPAPSRLVTLDPEDISAANKPYGANVERRSLDDSPVFPESAAQVLCARKEIESFPPFVIRRSGATVLVDGEVLENGGRDLLSESTHDFHLHEDAHSRLLNGNIPRIRPFQGRLAVVASPGGDNYFHWTLDCMPRLRLLLDSAEPYDQIYAHPGSFQKEWLEILGVAPSQIIPATSDTHLQPDEVVLPSFNGLPGLPSASALAFLNGLPSEPDPDSPRRIFLSRANARRRRLKNEEELFRLLEKRGFVRVEPGRLTVRQQMTMFRGADAVVGVHGAELTNLVYCRPGTRVLELFSPYYLNPCFRELAMLCGLHHEALVGEGGAGVLSRGEDAHWVWANLRVKAEQLMSRLDRLEEPA